MLENDTEHRALLFQRYDIKEDQVKPRLGKSPNDQEHSFLPYDIKEDQVKPSLRKIH